MTQIDKAEALLPCPFCGGEARKWQDPSHSAAWFIGCDDGDTDCFGSIHWAETEAEAIAAWNRRAALPARGVGVKPLDLSNALKHAFLSGVVAARDIEAGEPCVGADLWVEYDPTGEAAYNRILAALSPALAPTDAATEKGGDAFDEADDPGHARPATSPGVTAGVDAAQAREAHLREAAAAVRARYMGDNNREDQEVLRCEAAILTLIGGATPLSPGKPIAASTTRNLETPNA